MAFGITRDELNQWKEAVSRGRIAYLTHFWFDPRFPEYNTVTKVGCSNLDRLTDWCITNGLPPKYIHNRSPFPHFDLIGPKQKDILLQNDLSEQLERFNII
jgi:hypothetical protein